MTPTLRHLAAAATTVVICAGCSSTNGAAPAPTTIIAAPPIITADARSATNPPLLPTPTTVAQQLPPSSAPAMPSTARATPHGVNFDVDGNAIAPLVNPQRYPALDDYNSAWFGPLPQHFTESQGRDDPAAVARQWVGIRTILGATSDETWPYIVTEHQHALAQPLLSNPPAGDLIAIASGTATVADTTSEVEVTVSANAGGLAYTAVYAVTLERDPDGIWVVAYFTEISS